MAIACRKGREQHLNTSEATLKATKWCAEVMQYSVRMFAAANSPKGKTHPIATGQQDINRMFNPFLPPPPPPLTAEEKKARQKATAALIFGKEKANLMR